jgi:hypothetical protein
MLNGYVILWWALLQYKLNCKDGVEINNVIFVILSSCNHWTQCFKACTNLIPCGPFYNIFTIVEHHTCTWLTLLELSPCDEDNVWLCGWPCLVC